MVACLEPLASDAPGYSPRLYEADASVPVPGTALSRAIDTDDGVEGATVPRRAALLGGEAVEYWDFGTAPSVMRAAYQLYECRKGKPTEPLAHPIILSAIPGHADYSPFLALQPVCATSAYAGERITSTRALRDAIDLAIVKEPQEPHTWVNAPIVGEETSLEGEKGRVETIYYEGLALRSLRPGMTAPFTTRFVSTARVYELYLPGDVEPSQEVFEKSETPLWSVVRVQLVAEADLEMLQDARDLFDVDEEGALTPATDLVDSYEDTRDRVHRALAGRTDP